MKKFIVLLFTVVILCGCQFLSNSPGSDASYTGTSIVYDGDAYSLIELTFDGETHDYIVLSGYNRGGIAHWEGCKYCKERHEHEGDTIRDTIYIYKEKDNNIW